MAEKLDYVTNSFISEMEKGKVIPSKRKLKKIAKALGIAFKELNDPLMENKLKQLGIKEPKLINFFARVGLERMMEYHSPIGR